MSATAATDRVRLRLAAGVGVDDERDLSARVRRALAVARDVGAPLLPAVDAAAAAEDDAARSRRAVAVATAQARTVAGGLVLAPPLLVPLVGGLAGADVWAFYAAPAGRSVLGVGLGLLAAGALVARALVRRAARPGPSAGLEEVVELVATALGGGVGPSAALRTVADLEDGPSAGRAAQLRTIALEVDLGLDPGRGRDGSDAVARLRAALGLAVAVGAPAGPVLRRLAADLRAEDLARVLSAAERLPAQLTVPATLLLLPAAVLLIAAPILDAGLRTVVG
jgi:pilus assembly protein TadC